MKRRPIGAVLLLISMSLPAFAHAQASADVAIDVGSPNGRLHIIVRRDADDRLVNDVKLGGREITVGSQLGIKIDGQDLGTNAVAGEAVTRTIDESYPMLGGHSTARNHCAETIIPFTSSGVAWSLEVRAYDDGVAYRYQVPGEGKRHVDGEAGTWTLPTETTINFQPMGDRKDYEAANTRGRVSDLARMLAPRPPKPTTVPATAPAVAVAAPSRDVLVAPAMFELPAGGYVMLTEANLVNYSDMALEYVGDGNFRAFFHNQPDGWDWTGEIVSPWRTMIVAENLNALANSDLVRNLCPPASPELANADWIKPGRSTWHWMVTGRPKLEDQRAWVDRTREINFEYYLVDDGWNRWTDGSKDAWACMKDVVDYATTQNMKIWAWVDSKELLDEASREAWFAKARAAGVVGVKIDFMKPADVWWVNWYDDTLRDAAEHKLMINFHGSLKPTGRERTWPHNLTRESIRGRENQKQSATHDTILPFVRYVQGAADYTPTDFRTDRLRGSSFAHELSMAVIFTTPFLCYGGDPANYLASPAIDVIKTIPAVWDETIVLPGSAPGDCVAMARRTGDDWYVGVLNGKPTDDFAIDLKFLGAKKYLAVLLADAADRPDEWQRTEQTVDSSSTLRFDLLNDGGFVARLTPLP